MQIHPPTLADVSLPEVTETYRQLVGDLRYLADSTQFDLSYATGNLCTAVNQSTTRHWHSMKSKIRYLIHTANTGILFRSGQQRPPNISLLSDYSAFRFANYAKDRNSTLGCLLNYNTSPVALNSRKQNIFALSSTEAEYIALAPATQAILTAERMLVPIVIAANANVALHFDNQVAQDMMVKLFVTKMRKSIDL